MALDGRCQAAGACGRLTSLGAQIVARGGWCGSGPHEPWRLAGRQRQPPSWQPLWMVVPGSGAQGPLARSFRPTALAALAGLLLTGLRVAGHGGALRQTSAVGRAVCLPSLRWRLHRGRRRRGGVAPAATGASAGVLEVRKPDLDQRQYRHVTLPNGLAVLLASDPEADVAAASVSIKAGSFDDPVEYLGLAHFHEHMLFLGTQKYPDEDEYERFLKDHGGYSNAYTADEVTTYYFRVNSTHLPGALDRFAQFFIAPKFDPSAIDREMKVVDSESTNYAADEGWRRAQVMKATAEEQHPFHRFSVGNLDTLGHSGEDAVREAMVSWNRARYHARAMRLAVIGKESLDELEHSVQAVFGSVRAAPEPGSAAQAPTACLPWTQARLGNYLEVVPKIEDRSISVSWPLPSARKHLYSKFESYLSHVLGHEADGSLHAQLNKDGLIDHLTAGTMYSFDDAQLLAIDVSLTLEGERRVAEVLDRIFAYVALLRETGPRLETFEELRLINEIGFRFREESPAPEDSMASASLMLHYYPPHEVLSGPSTLQEWLPNELRSWLQQLDPRRCIIVQSSPDFAQAAEAEAPAEPAPTMGQWGRERWYGALFRSRELSNEELHRWANPPAEVRADLVMPPDNPFVPRDFSLRCDKAPGAAAAEKPQTALEVTPPAALRLDDPLLHVWLKTDSTYRVPMAHVYANIVTPVYSMGPTAVVMLRLFCSLLRDDLNTYAYSAMEAGLSYSVAFGDRFTFQVGGFNDKLPVLLLQVGERLQSLLSELTEAARSGEHRDYWVERLVKQRELALRDYENFFREDPMDVAVYHMRHMFMTEMWHISEYVDVLQSFDGSQLLEPLTESVRKAFSNVQVEVLAHGNVDAEEARNNAQVIRSSLPGQLNPLEDAKLPADSVVLPPPEPDSGVVFHTDIEAMNPLEENSAIINVYQVGPSIEDPRREACLITLSQLAETSAFTQLRTRENLGYVVSAGRFSTSGVSGLSVAVKSARLPPAGLDARIEAWLGQFRQELVDMTEETFSTNVQAAIHHRSQRHKQLAQEVGRHWDEISRRTYSFDRRCTEVAALRQISRQDVLELFDQHLCMGAPLRRKLSSQITGAAARRQAEEEEGTPETVEGMPRTLRTLEEVRAFKTGLPTHSETQVRPRDH